MTTETRIGIVAGLLIVVAASVYFFYGSEKDEDGVLVAGPTRVTVPPKIPVSTDKKATPNRITRVPVRSPSGPLANNFAQRKPPNRPLTPPGATSPNSSINALPVKQADSPVALRTGPSTELVEATWDNLLKREKPPTDNAKPSGVSGPINPAPVLSAPRGAPRVITPPSAPVTTPKPTPIVSTNLPPAARPVESSGSSTWPKRHTIAAGETLSGISKEIYGDSSHSAEILTANPQIKSARSLKIGDVLTLPEPKSTTGRPAPAAAAEQPSAHPSAAVESPASSTTAARTYTVQSGDTLYSIAKKQCGSSSRWKEILKLNKDALKGSASRLSPGMVLKLPE